MTASRRRSRTAAAPAPSWGSGSSRSARQAERGAARSGPSKRLNASSAGRIASTASESPSVVAASRRLRSAVLIGAESSHRGLLPSRAMTDLSRLVVPMRGRDAHEQRAATPLELFFDLVIVVAVAVAARELHHDIAEAHIGEGILAYGMTLFAIWWAWMSFSWFATAYDTDDVPYRVAVFVQMAGAVIMAGGIARAFEQQDWSIVTFGYVIMRFASVFQWSRAARSDRSHRPNSIRWVIGIILVQVGWVLLLLIPL